MAKIVNGVNFLERLKDGTKKIIAVPDQIKRLKKMMLDYNGTKYGVRDYENLEVYLDPGAGGNGSTIATYLLDDWVGHDGQKHKGIIDKEDKYLAMEAYKFPEAKNILHMPTAQAHKLDMYSALTDMIEQNLIIFPRPLNLRQEFEFETEGEDGKLVCRYEKAAPEEVRAMTELDLMVTEVTSMQRVKTPNGNIVIKLPKTLERKLHDDRAYCLAMLAFHLNNLRVAERLAKEKGDSSWKKKYCETDNKYRPSTKFNQIFDNQGLFQKTNIKNLF